MHRPKVRLVKGPFGGKVINHPRPGEDTIVLSGPKKMNRQQQFDWQRNQTPYSMGRLPTVRAYYRLAMRVQGDGHTSMNLPLFHPDGSVFYEYVEGSKSEFT